MRRAIAALGTILLLTGAANARADTILLTSGFLEMSQGMNAPVAVLQGTGGFFAHSLGTALYSGRFDAWRACAAFPACHPGDMISLMAGWSGSDLPGIVSYEGNTFHVGGGHLPELTFMFNGEFTVPPNGGFLTAPFTATGHMAGGTVVEFPSVALTGAGTVSIWLSPWMDPPYPNAWRLDRIRYEIGSQAPVPEPASTLLLCAGLGGVLAAARRRRPRT